MQHIFDVHYIQTMLYVIALLLNVMDVLIFAILILSQFHFVIILCF